jgi:hypothetical protein
VGGGARGDELGWGREGLRWSESEIMMCVLFTLFDPSACTLDPSSVWNQPFNHCRAVDHEIVFTFIWSESGWWERKKKKK